MLKRPSRRLSLFARRRAAAFVFLAANAFAACRSDISGSAPNFSLVTRQGDTVSLSAQRGRVVLVNFWATWCDSCKEELPTLEALQHLQMGDRFKLLAINVDDDPARTVPPFAAAHHMDVPILYADRKVLDDYAVRMLPTSYLIAPDGSIARRYVGPLDAHEVENDILGLLDPNRRSS